MAEKKVLLIDMYGVIIKESKGYFIPYTLEHFEKAEHERLIRAFRDEQCFTKAGNGDLSSYDFLTQINYYMDGIWLYYTNRRVLYLMDGMISSIPLAYKREEAQDNDDEWIYTYEAADGETLITEEEYDNAADLYFDDYAKKRIRIRWLDSKECEVFHGTTQEIYEALHMSLQESSFAERKAG